MVDERVRKGAAVAAATLLIAACAHVAFPLWFTPVPVTLQPFAVLLLGLLMTPGLAATTMVLYLAEGALGLPVFTPHGLGGIAQLLGPTGGYLMSYPLVAPLISWLWRQGSRGFARTLAIATAGSLVTLALGALWLEMLTRGSFSLLLSDAVVPFLAGDAVKVVAAATMATSWTRFRLNLK
jgi:biotin transport system substrate-specific component